MDMQQVKIGANNVYVSPRGFVYLGDMICPVNQLNWTVKIREDWHSLEKIVHKKFPRWTVKNFSENGYELEINRWYQRQMDDINGKIADELQELENKFKKAKEKVLESYSFEVRILNDIYEEY